MILYTGADEFQSKSAAKFLVLCYCIIVLLVRCECEMPGELWFGVKQCYNKKDVPQRVRKQLHNVVIVV